MLTTIVLEENRGMRWSRCARLRAAASNAAKVRDDFSVTDGICNAVTYPFRRDTYTPRFPTSASGRDNPIEFRCLTGLKGIQESHQG